MREADTRIGVAQVADLLGGVSEATVRRWEKNGLIPPAERVGLRKDRFWRLSEIEAFLKGKQQEREDFRCARTVEGGHTG